MKVIFFILIFSFQLWAQESKKPLIETKNNIRYAAFGKPLKQGFWEMHPKGYPLKLILETMQSREHMIVKEGKDTKLIPKRKTLFNESGALSSSWSSTMNEQSCSSVDMSAKAGPVREQWENTCYANVALDLITFDRPGSYSALYAAHLNQNSGKLEGSPYFLRRVSGFNGGTIRIVVQQALENGLCPQSAIKDSFVINGDRTMHYDNILIYFEHQRLRGMECDAGLEKIKGDIATAFPGLPLEDFKSIFNSSKSIEEFIRGLYAKACEGKMEHETLKDRSMEKFKASDSVVVNNNKAVGVFEEDRPGLLAHINDTLAQGRPAAILYSMNSMLVNNYTDDINTHGGLVVGREWHEEQIDSKGEVVLEAGCYYITKNSWGEDWIPPQDVAAKRWKKPGYFMVSEKDLMNHVFETNSF